MADSLQLNVRFTERFTLTNGEVTEVVRQLQLPSLLKNDWKHAIVIFQHICEYTNVFIKGIH